MSALFENVRKQAEALRSLRDGHSVADVTNPGETALLRELASAMVHEESSFDPVHGAARILGATETRGEIRLAADGSWKLGSSPEKELLAAWGSDGLPTLDALLEGVQKNFSSARIGNLVAETRELLGRDRVR